MAWIGYYEWSGTEIINVARTEAYARNAGAFWFKPVYKNEALAPMLGEDYHTPLQDDDVPWTDPDDPNSFAFFGVYPLDVAGIEDSTATATVTESTLDGGVVGRTRRATRTVTFSLALLGASECAVEYGMRWLRAVLTGGPCAGRDDQVCTVGNDLCYLACEPALDWQAPDMDVRDCLDPFMRTIHRTTATVGPQVTGKQITSDGGCVWLVSLTIVAADPFEYGLETQLIRGFADPKVDMPYVGGEVPPGGSFNDNGFVQFETRCPKPSYQPVYDPLCPQVIPPPPVPNVSLSCFSFPTNYLRRQFVIPPQNVPLWNDVVPVLTLRAPSSQDVRNVRFRFYVDADGDGSAADEKCNFCGDFVVTYVPANTALILDGVSRTVLLQSPGATLRRADTLVYASDGTPFEWPVLTCGLGYVVTVDMPQNQVPPAVDLALATRAG